MALLFLSTAVAQSTFGSFVGTVKDSSGAIVPDCVVTLTNTGTSATRTTITDKDGNYVLINIDAGMYKLTMEAPGFQVANFPNLTLTARQTVRIDGALGVAQQAETVNVSASSEAVITTEVSSIAETRSGRELLDLPVAIGSRAAGSTSPISTLTTQAGVQVDNSGGLSVAGSKPSMLSVTVDGISTMSVRTNAAAAELFPSFGTIAEIRVSEINNAAEFGGVSDITTVSKSGSNSFHGGLYENLQNTSLNARNPFAAARSKTIMNNYGGFVGGPVIKDKTFFFASYEALKLPRQQFINQSVPSVALRNGDLSAYSGTIKDPLTGVPFANNQIPLNRISPIALNALQYLFPLPNTGAPNAIANNYALNLPVPITSHQGDLRMDQNISARQTAFVRLTYKDRDVVSPPTSAQAVTTAAGAAYQPERDVTIAAAHNFVVTPRIVNELRMGLSDVYILTSTDANAADLVKKIGVAVPDAPGGSATPNFVINGFQNTQTAASSISRSKTIQLLDNVSINAGSHTYKFGADIRQLSAYFNNVFATTRVGAYTYNGSITNSVIGNPYAAFLLGVPDRAQVTSVINPDSNGRSIHYAFYAQDDWKISPRLTINYGLRWEYHPPFTDRLANLAVFLPDYYSVVNGVGVRGAVAVPDAGMNQIHPTFAASILPTPIMSATQAGIPQQLHRSQKTSFAPRIGFAWRPNDKTVIRGGYGRFIEAMLGTLTSAGWAVEASSVGSYTNSLVNGQPVLQMPYPFPANLAQPGSQSFQLSGDVNYRDPYVQQWSLTVERDLGFGTGVRVTYDGNHGANLGYTKNLAQIAANTVGFAAAKSFSPFPIWNNISQNTTGARSNYHAITISGNKRMSHGLQFSANYAFARNLSNGQGFNPTAFATQAGGVSTDSYNVDADYGNVAFTRRQRFQTTFLYELPFGKKGMFFNKSKIADQIIGGWQVSGVMLFQTGPFMTVVAPGADPAGNNFPNVTGNGRADWIAGQSLAPANQSITNWINKAAYAIPANNIGRIATSPVGSVTGPGTQAMSLSLYKTFSITEGIRLQLGAAASNALNHPNYTTPNLNYNTAPFGTITNVQNQESGGARSVQVTARISF